MSDYKGLEITEVIYESVSRNDLQDMDRGTVEMILDICDNIKDCDFRKESNTHQLLQRTGSDCVKNRNYRAAVVCLILLCVLLLTAVVVLSFHIHTNNTNCKTELWKCLHEMDEWIYYQSSLYYVSSEKKSWNESRQDCLKRGSDLIIINNKEEQNFIRKIAGSGVWIGLTDIDEEDSWKWVDGINLTSGFWNRGEPTGNKKESCVYTNFLGWVDHLCTKGYPWICEKNF